MVALLRVKVRDRVREQVVRHPSEDQPVGLVMREEHDAFNDLVWLVKLIEESLPDKYIRHPPGTL